MVLLIIIPIKWLFHWEYTLFSDKPIWLPQGKLPEGIHPRFQASCNVLDTDGKTPLRLAAGRVRRRDVARPTMGQPRAIAFRGP